jgi:hypothetical protein
MALDAISENDSGPGLLGLSLCLHKVMVDAVSAPIIAADL